MKDLKYKNYRESKLSNDEKSFAYQKRYIDTYKNIIDIPSKARILDLGCGSGDFIKTCNKLGYDCYGIDADECDFEIDCLPFENNSFDIVHFNAVIEHLSNPENILSEIKDMLKKDGVVIINTPNFSQDYRNFYNDPTHVKPYTEKSLQILMEMHGFKTIFLEPAVICHKEAKKIYNMKDEKKWDYAAKIKGGSKSILGVFKKC